MPTSSSVHNSVVLGIDVGTTSVKASAVDEGGVTVASAGQHYALDSSKPNRAEQDPKEIVDAVTNVTRRIVETLGQRSRQISALAMGSAFHSVIALSADGTPLTKSITWADNRSAAIAQGLRGSEEGIEVYRRTGLPIHAMSPLTKIIWLRQHEPDLFAKTASFVSIKDYLIEHMTGVRSVDYTMASAMGLFDVRRRVWDAGALAVAGLHPYQLPEVVSPTTVIPRLLPEFARAVNLGVDVPVVVGAGDGALANIGSGAIGAKKANLTLGTSIGLRMVLDTPRTDTTGSMLCYAVTDDRWLVGYPGSSGGIMFSWLRDLLANGGTHNGTIPPPETFDIPIGANGLLCLPFLTGERAPNHHPDSRAVYFGMSLHHRAVHLWRAAAEGVCMVARGMRNCLQETCSEISDIRLSGSIAGTPQLATMLGDVLGQTVKSGTHRESSVYGAVLLARVAMGAYATIDEAAASVAIEREFAPEPRRVELFNAVWQRWNSIHGLLEPAFNDITQMPLETSTL
jgi:gluconokinase